jgi:hypothetical protein
MVTMSSVIKVSRFDHGKNVETFMWRRYMADKPSTTHSAHDRNAVTMSEADAFAVSHDVVSHGEPPSLGSRCDGSRPHPVA